MICVLFRVATCLPVVKWAQHDKEKSTEHAVEERVGLVFELFSGMEMIS
jgi:hypothetical protein